VQLQSASRNAQINEEVLENNLKLKDQMQSLTTNLSSLNNVYECFQQWVKRVISFELYKKQLTN
jgi:hypothetical protein